MYLRQLLKSSYIFIRIRGFAPRKLVNFLSELVYFYWKICILNTLYIPPRANQGGPRLYQRGPGPPGPTLATALQGISNMLGMSTDQCMRILVHRYAAIEMQILGCAQRFFWTLDAGGENVTRGWE